MSGDLDIGLGLSKAMPWVEVAGGGLLEKDYRQHPSLGDSELYPAGGDSSRARRGTHPWATERGLNVLIGFEQIGEVIGVKRHDAVDCGGATYHEVPGTPR